MREIALLFVALLLPFAPGEVAGQDGEDPKVWDTGKGYFRVSYESRLHPLAINRIHAWVFHVETANGDTVNDATISVTGGMPNHNHGLPTSPRMTQSLGEGNYLLEGMRFHMAGLWEITVIIEAGGQQDTVVISLTL